MVTTAPSGFSRRRFLQSLGTIGVAGAAAVVTRNAIATAPQRAQVHQPPHFEGALWHDPRTWPNGRVPGPGDIARITRPVIVDADARVAGVQITAQGALVFAPQATARLESSGNVVVEGRLVMRTGTPGVRHTLRFVDVDESRFTDGGMEVREGDVGLWVMHRGGLDLQGSPKTAWTRAPSQAQGWLPDDECIITPTKVGDYQTRRWFPGDPVPRAYADVPAAEVANLTRNVVVEGTPDGRSHVFIHSQTPQTLRFVEFRHLGPRRSSTRSDNILGRWGVHFHHVGDGSRGSLVEGCVAHKMGAHAFVPHASHGIRFKDCVAHDVIGEPYWWDPGVEEASHDIVFERCLAAQVASDENHHTNAGFRLKAGHGNKLVGCVAAAIGGGQNSSGVVWAGSDRPDHPWVTEGLVVHNNRRKGIYWWQNNYSGPEHRTLDTVIYNCGVAGDGRSAGVFQGAYRNGVHHHGLLQRGCHYDQHSSAKDDPIPQGLIDCDIDVAGQTPQAIRLSGANLPADIPTLFLRGRIAGYTDRPVTVECNDNHRKWDFVNVVKADGTDLEPDDIRRVSGTDWVLRVQRRNGTAWRMTANGQVTTIPPFHGD